MAFDISNFDKTKIYITDGWREWYLPKFRIYMTVDEPFITIYWTDTEKGSPGLTRSLTMDYNDVTFGYDTPSSASEVELQINIYIDSAWDDITGFVESVTVESNQPVTVDNTDPLNPVIGFDGYTPIADETADFTLDVSYAWKYFNADTASSLEITVPPNSSQAFPIGTQILVSASNSGLVFFSPGSGVTIHAVDDFYGIVQHYGVVTLQKIATNEWLLYGDTRIALDSDAEAYINAVEATGVSFTNDEKGYINDFFLTLKASSGLYAKFYYIYLFLGATAAAHKFNAVDPQDTDAAFRMTFTGSPTHNANGVTFNGSSQYGDTKMTPLTTMNIDSKNYTVYLRTNGTGFVYGAQESALPNRADKLSANFSSGGTIYWGLSDAGDTVANPSPNTGIWSQNRSASNSSTLKRVDSTIDSNTTASAWNPNLAMWIGCRNFGGAANSYNACNVAFFSASESLTTGEQTTLYNAIVTLNTAFGR